MTTLQTPLSSTDLTAHPIRPGHLEYFRARVRSKLHQLVLREFFKQEDRGLTQAELSRRLGKRTEVINRLLGAPGNWTLNTVSDLMLGMGAELTFSVSCLFPLHVGAMVPAKTVQPSALGQSQEINAGANLEIIIASSTPSWQRNIATESECLLGPVSDHVPGAQHQP
jgi:hypothetical protein